MDNPELYFAFLGVTLVLELMLWYSMPTWYYQSGLPIFTRSAQVSSTRRQPPSDLAIEQAHPTGSWGTFKFKQFEDGVIGVREASGWTPNPFLGYTPLMHATLRMDANAQTVTITGYLNIYMLGFFEMFIYSLNQQPEDRIVMVAGFVLIIGLLYTIQAVRYLGVLDSAKKAWKN